MKKSVSSGGPNPSELITNQIAELGDWRGKLLARLRKVVLEAAPEITEEWKWGTAVWTHKGLIRTAVAHNLSAAARKCPADQPLGVAECSNFLKSSLWPSRSTAP